MKPEKVALNDYPSRDEDISVFDFVTGDRGGSMASVVDFLNAWASESENIKDFHLVRYEDLRSDTRKELAGLLRFMSVDASEAQVDRAIEYASYENMKRMESKKQFRLSGGRMMPGDKDNPDSYKVRRAKVGGYRDYFSDDEVATIDRMLADSLDPSFRYS
jgi:alcohol sulfotransferase